MYPQARGVTVAQGSSVQTLEHAAPHQLVLYRCCIQPTVVLCVYCSGWHMEADLQQRLQWRQPGRQQVGMSEGYSVQTWQQRQLMCVAGSGTAVPRSKASNLALFSFEAAHGVLCRAVLQHTLHLCTPVRLCVSLNPGLGPLLPLCPRSWARCTRSSMVMG
jgi:hypothetical protein